MDTETRCPTAAGPAVLWAVWFEVERAFERARADENHDQIGRINRQVMDSCVILVGRAPRSPALSSLTLLFHPLDLHAGAKSIRTRVVHKIHDSGLLFVGFYARGRGAGE